MRKNKLFKYIMIIAFIAWAFVIVKQQFNIAQYKNELENLSSKIEIAQDKLNENKKELEEENKNINSLEYIEKLAREKLGMYLQNERVYVDSNM